MQEADCVLLQRQPTHPLFDQPYLTKQQQALLTKKQ
jgi:hypothetical protein